MSIDRFGDFELDRAAGELRLRLAACLAKEGDSEEGEIELSAARKAFERAGARFYVEQCEALQRTLHGNGRSARKRGTR